MAHSSGPRSGGRILVDALVGNGVDRAFGVPGESYLAVLDALHDTPQIAFTVCRQEGGAAMMADAYGKMTGRPGICFVTRGPGATNASAGVHVAHQDSTPMILFVGQVARAMREREAFQEIEYRQMYAPLAKWVAEIDSAERIPEFVARAFRTATSGRPGPVVLALPEDVLSEEAAVEDVAAYEPVAAAPSAADMARFRELLAAARRPVAIVGHARWDEPARRNLRNFAEANALPVAAAFRYQDVFDNTHPCYVGDVGLAINPKLAETIRQSDLLLAIGPRLGEATTNGYTLIRAPVPEQKLVHVFPAAEELGRVYTPVLGIASGMPQFADALAALAPVENPKWREWTQGARHNYLAWTEPVACPGEVQMAEVMAWLRERLPEDAVITNGAGNFAGWVHRFYRFRGWKTQLAPTSGSMGYGVPAAVAAKLTAPERLVVAFAGDGDFQMTGQELGTAVQYGAAIVVIVVNNEMYGTIRMHQEREYPGRESATALVNPDFVALARAYGAWGEKVSRTADFGEAFEAAVAAGRPALIELKLDPEAITTFKTLSEIRQAAKDAGR
ncbi:MAG: thiamine pyrophosphate-binding protein [Rhodovibrionaceae bacterium]|nr:thiamine pyrophosphate-binding protein [Rhodovibrionaceae bacterium]